MSEAENEIVEQHRLIEALLRGEATEESLAAFAGVLTPRFEIWMPDGEVGRRADVVDGIARSAGSDPGLRITIDAVRVVAADIATVVATYDEHHARPDGATSRRSTAVFVRDPDARHGLLWEHLHETWRPDPA
ncbi:hypothetical protein CLV30_105195 [Haloactinopolyspora alba]|uniref:Sucrose-phosphatase C-terminal domain-containing protein n=1 Tax=Haloactinopolyspora alba TaxID=648780 RepID=A0A2P8E5I0_9ACTN|nr:DUF4440 domain-containing protein [Haloactinopolyspora alba]PSL04728.1 hypothetical protein CLV30_105195 [Haloactinopolyspora alba]